MIAMALVLEPKLLIADEPTTALDVTTQKQILTLIRDLQRDHGTAVLFITHDMGVVAEIADRVAVMRSGRLVETGKLDTILRQPAMEYTRNLLASVPSLMPRAPRDDTTEPVVLETNQLGKIYRERSFFGKTREVAAAEGVTLTLHKGRTLGIVGESGSGKSTVARCIVRLIDPTSGGVRLAGREISDLSRRLLQPHRKRIQIIFQDPYRSLNPRVTIGETIAEARSITACPATRRWQRRVNCWNWSICRPTRSPATRINSPAASASASRLPGHWRSIPTSWSPTRRSRPSTCPCRRRCSSCSMKSRPGSASRCCSSPMTFALRHRYATTSL